ncbi:flagellar biosynthesis protein FlhA [Halobacteroides halobius DSM 5150]|uniref:Flagellar biosynthesis protein FlhA n=1 Tax=Halobacteroides halobius (strain ATCC 35273 / DSM 5150 / MD-1) TaxID=748449 RepID=L0K6I9_HALHC|nr:flagellar biosynthesis protein FlhA [Halobacteroides halobius]AGB40646.1 flagellar biosynthesis protein FlhA [Halobacteroides halobius DSM 5150]
MASTSQGLVGSISEYNDLIFAIAVIMIVVMFIIPLPTILLDILLTLNISLALTILLVAMYLSDPLELSVFPSLLLIATLFRLGLNVSTTRLILSQGSAGQVIEAFGSFVLGGNYIVGVVIFIILVVIQFMVITKGSERVSEVTARFTLDAMPGKQMSIDADLSSGLITEAEARAKREKIRQEADFYGAMDGASKFVKGDAIAGIVITLINILGGLTIGVIQQGMPITDALQTYTLLTVGDGLVSQIPALLISTATGIVVTRAASEGNLGSDFTKQLFAQPKALWLVAGVLSILGILTPLPTIPFVGLALLFAGLSYLLYENQQTAQLEEEFKEEDQEAEEYREEESIADLLQVDPMELEVGYNLIPLVVPEQGGDLLDRVSMIRRQCALELGIVIPPIRIRDNMQLEPDYYQVNLRGIQIASHEIKVDKYMAMDSGMATEEIQGIETTEPAFDLPALWIDEEQKERAEMSGYTVVDPPSVMATHLTELVKDHAYELLGRQEVKELIDNVKEDYPAVVDELIPDLLSIGQVQKVLQNLLKERVSVRDLVSILEVLADQAHNTQDTDILTEYVRQDALSRQISKKYKDEQGNLHVLTLDSQVEETISNSIEQTEQGSYIALDPNLAQQIYNSLAQMVEQMVNQGYDPIVLTSPILRFHFKELTEQVVPNLTVLSFNELESDVNVQNLGAVTI